MFRLHNCKKLYNNSNIFLSFFLITIYSFFEIVCCEKLLIISDQAKIIFSLKNHNVSDTDSLEMKYIMKPHTSCEIHITSIPDDVYFVVVQAHSFMQNLTLSYNKMPKQETSISGTNIGLLKMNNAPVLTFYLFYNSPADNATILITVQPYKFKDPIPGGCNMEFQVEISPFLKTTFNEDITEVDFAPAAPPFSLVTNETLNSNELCNVKSSPITYKMYRMYLPEGNFSEEVYFNSLKLMMSKSSILQNGKLIPDKYGISPMRHSFASYPGTGRVFVVIAETQEGSSVYVPSFTYSCHIENEKNNCRILRTIFSKLLCATVFFVGLFACFAAHRFFSTELMLLGFTCGTILSYVAALHFVESEQALNMALFVGFICSVSFLLIWCFRGLPLLTLILSTSVFGYLMASSLFYKIVDFLDVLQSDINYWSLFCSLVLLSPLLMISLSEKANITACSVVGSYATVVALDYYLGSNLRYIVINTFRRATVERFKTAIIDPPYQLKDASLTLLWIILSIAGIVVQIKLMKDKAPYPAPSNFFQKLYGKFKRQHIYDYVVPGERTSLLRPCA